MTPAPGPFPVRRTPLFALTEMRWAGAAVVLFLIGVGLQLSDCPMWSWWTAYLACYVAGGWEDNNATSEYEVGGRNGTLLNVVPGLSVGNLTQMFFVRGFAPGTQDGTRALSGSVEYRLPLAVAASVTWALGSVACGL